MTNPAVKDPQCPLTDDLLLAARIADLLRGATRRQMWLLFLDDDDVQQPPVMPCDDLPADPLVALGGGDLTPAAALARMLDGVMAECGFAKTVFVWERPGHSRLRAQERSWARAMQAACVARGVRVRAQFLLHDNGVRQLAPDDIV